MRLDTFQRILRQEQIGACVLLNNDPDVFYFAGVDVEKCVLLIPDRGKPVLVVSELEAERVRKSSRVKSVDVFRSGTERNSIIAGNLKGKGILAINKAAISVANMEFLQALGKPAVFADASKIIDGLRQIKTNEEIEIIREACRLTDKVMQDCINSFDFRTELDVKNFLESEARNLGCKPSFDTIVASGKNASMPHYSGNGRLNKGFCVIDFGIRYKGYCSDMTRTICIGKPSRAERELYSLVRQSQQKGIDAVKEGAVAEDVDSAARSALGKHKEAFIHGLGHHIGVEVHDTDQRISPRSKWLLKENMAVTIEPGIYYKGKLGIRIEDDVLVRKGGCEELTRTDKELVIV